MTPKAIEPDNTIDSEVEKIVLMVWADGKDEPYEMRTGLQRNAVEEAKTALKNLIAQEANKARLDELNRLYATSGLRAITLGYISDRIDALTADKEQA